MTTNRARLIVLEPNYQHTDDPHWPTDPIRSGYGYYGGYIAHSYAGPNPAPFYLWENPNPVHLAEMIRLIRQGKLKAVLLRELWSENGIEYDLDQVMLDIAAAMQHHLMDPPMETSEFARCWEGIKVLEAMAVL